MADNLVILGAGKQGVNRHAAKMRLRGAENIREMLWKFLNRQLRAGQITPEEHAELRRKFWDDRYRDLVLIRGGALMRCVNLQAARTPVAPLPPNV
jgi:hypothetical protein